MKIPLSIERLIRAAGATVMAVVATQVIPSITAAIPPQYALIAGPIINGLFKDLRTRYKNNKFLKLIPL